jgi:hypothetical protein
VITAVKQVSRTRVIFLVMELDHGFNVIGI